MVTEKELSRMEFNPVVKKSLTAVYPKLKAIFGNADDRMVRYVLLMYDRKSPMREYYPDLAKRKEFCAAMAGYDIEKEDMGPLFDFRVKTGEDTFETNEEMLSMIVSYLKYQNNYLWAMVVNNEQAFYEFSKRVMVPVEGGKDKDMLQAVDIKNKLMEAQDNIVQRLEKYMRELTGGDDNLAGELGKRKGVSPESIAVR